MKRGIFITEINNLVDAVKRFFITNVFAEEEQNNTGEEDSTTNEGASSSTTINYEDLIAKARQEEKQKQYNTIEKLRNQISTLTQQHNEDLLKIAELENEVTGLKSSIEKKDSQKVKDLKEEIETLKKNNKKLGSTVKDYETNTVGREELEKEIREQMESEYAVKAHKVEVLAKYKEELLVPELVFGDTIEEIDASLKSALERSQAIRDSLGASQQSHRRLGNITNPSVSGIQNQNINSDYISNLDVKSKEYAEMRKQLGLR